MQSTKSNSSLIFLFLFSVLLLPAMGKDPADDNPEAIEKRIEFFQKNFDKFIPVKFKKATATDAMMQLLPSNEARFDYEGAHYCGFKFTVPEWADGDFEWVYLFAKNAGNKDFVTRTLSWFIVPETGRCKGFSYFRQIGLTDKYPELKDRYPHTGSMTVQNLDADRMIPGKAYAIWFRYEEDFLPDIAFSMTIASERGAKEFGVLPLK